MNRKQHNFVRTDHSRINTEQASKQSQVTRRVPTYPVPSSLHVGDVFAFEFSLSDPLFSVHYGHQVGGFSPLQSFLEGLEGAALESTGSELAEIVLLFLFLGLDLLPLLGSQSIGNVTVQLSGRPNRTGRSKGRRGTGQQQDEGSDLHGGKWNRRRMEFGNGKIVAERNANDSGTLASIPMSFCMVPHPAPSTTSIVLPSRKRRNTSISHRQVDTSA